MSKKKTDAPAQDEVKIVAYKGFTKDLKSTHGNSFQFEIGKEYVHEGEVARCNSGFHACENPLDVLEFYPYQGFERYAEVEQSGKLDRSHDKTASACRAIATPSRRSTGNCKGWPCTIYRRMSVTSLNSHAETKACFFRLSPSAAASLDSRLTRSRRCSGERRKTASFRWNSSKS